MKIWLDDVFPPNVSTIEPEATDWKWVLNFHEFMEALRDHADEIELISYDNDLGEEKEGKHCFNEMEAILHEGGLTQLKRVILHSDNSSAVISLMTAKDSLESHFGISLERYRRLTSSLAAKPTQLNKKSSKISY